MAGEERTPFPQETQLYTLAAGKPVLSPEGTRVLLHSCASEKSGATFTLRLRLT